MTTPPRFPLFQHRNGQWAKKIDGKLGYFGVDRLAALRKYEAHLRSCTTITDRVTFGARFADLQLHQLVTSFLASKMRLLDSGELRPRTLNEYQENCDRVMKVFGPDIPVSSLGPLHFERLRADFASTHKPPTLCGDIACARVLFKYAHDTFDIRVRYGQSFKKPSQAVLRKYRLSKPAKLFTADEVRRMLAAVQSTQLRAMILLGINCGFGNNDCATLPVDAIDSGWINFARPKTGIMRRCPLWPETVDALKETGRAGLNDRAQSGKRTPCPLLACRAFTTKYGNSWEAKNRNDPISQEFAKLLRSLGLHRSRVGFYALRHTFQTIGNRARDKDAVRAIMGHVPPSNDMSAAYTEEPVDDGRLRAVTDYVRQWLLGSPHPA
jgi:integrase